MQAARLATRLQRELSMLQSDPPFGICVWPSENKLNHLEAQLQGPEGTVYAKGMFRLEIQVPDRYPFEPPCVRFKTSIYHPNVDTGGRICLDLLTMPPKGSWKPSLNISTLLTSIGLLLAEPNPDDGLMSDITAEYKHNRPSFDMKARSWTEKYASENHRDIFANVLETGSFAKIAPQQVGEGIGTSTSRDLIQENMAGSNVTGLSDETLSGKNNYEKSKLGKLALPEQQVQKRMKLSLETSRAKSVITGQDNMEPKSVDSSGLSKHQNTSNEGMCSSMRAALETSRNSSIISNCENHKTSEFEGMEDNTSQSGRYVELTMETNTQGVDDVKGKRLLIDPGIGTSHKETNRTSPLPGTAPQNAGRYKGILCKKLTTSTDKLSKCDANTDVQTSHIYEPKRFSGGLTSQSFMSKVPEHSLSGDDIKQATSKLSLNEPGKQTVAKESNTEPMECQKVGNAYSDITCIVVADSESEDDKPVNPRSRLSLRQKSLALRRKPQFKLKS